MTVQLLLNVCFHWRCRPADTWTGRAVCMTSTLHPLIVGVVVAVATGLGKGVWTCGACMLQSLMSSSGCFEKMHL